MIYISQFMIFIMIKILVIILLVSFSFISLAGAEISHMTHDGGILTHYEGDGHMTYTDPDGAIWGWDEGGRGWYVITANDNDALGYTIGETPEGYTGSSSVGAPEFGSMAVIVIMISTVAVFAVSLKFKKLMH